MKSCGKVRNNDSMAPQKMGQGTINQKNKYLGNSKCKQRTIVLSFSKWEHWGSLVMEKQQEKQVCSQTHKAGSHLRGTLYLLHLPGPLSPCISVCTHLWFLLAVRSQSGIWYSLSDVMTSPKGAFSSPALGTLVDIRCLYFYSLYHVQCFLLSQHSLLVGSEHHWSPWPPQVPVMTPEPWRTTHKHSWSTCMSG